MVEYVQKNRILLERGRVCMLSNWENKVDGGLKWGYIIEKYYHKFNLYFFFWLDKILHHYPTANYILYFFIAKYQLNIKSFAYIYFFDRKFFHNSWIYLYITTFFKTNLYIIIILLNIDVFLMNMVHDQIWINIY